MKRILAIALSAVALTATTTQAVAQSAHKSLPQPSFVDYVEIEPGDASAGGSAAAMSSSRREFPRPSFVDYVAIEPDESASAGGSSGVALREGFPQPSFIDYPEGGRSSPSLAGQPYLWTGR